MINNTKSDLLHFVRLYLENRPLFMSFIRPQEAFLFNRYQNYIKSKVLDLGCGDGFFADITFGKGLIDIGLDVEDSRAPQAEGKNIFKKIVYYDGETIPFPKNSFSTVVSNCVLEHIPNIQRTIEETYRIVKPGGYFLTSVMADKWDDYLFGSKLFGDAYKSYMRKKQVHFNLFSQKKWDSLFKKAGFTIIKVDGYLPARAALWDDISHYLSLPSLASYTLTRKWVIWPKWYRLLQIDHVINNLLRNAVETPPLDSAALFYILKK